MDERTAADMTRPQAAPAAGAVDRRPFVDVQALFKRFDNRGAPIDILQGVDLTLGQGETLAVVGASGIGKSTFLHILGTLDRPDGGRIVINGEDVFALDNSRLAQFRNQMIGFMFQFHHLLPEFTALENVMMPPLIAGKPRRQVREPARWILKRVGLEHRLDHRIGELSGGEQQRVALARALVMQPRLFLADEPTGNLDRRNSDQVHALLRELNRELSMTMVVVTHNMQLASYMSRCVTIVDGQMQDKV